MKKVTRFWQVAAVDTLGVLLMIAALLTGWLPGPGGIPLLILGLSLLAINHTWARRYINLLRDYADRASDVMFPANPWIRAGYDLLAVILSISGAVLLARHSAIWTTSLGFSLVCSGLLIFLGNRDRWGRIKRYWRSR